MKVYFQIQWKIINRHIKEADLNVLLAWVLASISFIGLSIILFSQYEYAKYLYVVLPLFFSIRIGDSKRNTFLKICYGVRKFRLLRLFESLFISIPFLTILVINQSFLVSSVLVVIISTLTLFERRSNFRFIVPTPFQKLPFEFIIGFRRSFLAVAIIYAITIISIKVDNFNLGLFSIGLSFLCTLSYYSFMEDKVYVWSHIKKPRGFLLKKIRVAAFCNSILYLPLIGLLSFFFYENIHQLLILYGLGLFFIVAIIFMKYSAFPKQAGLRESIVLSVTFYFPPIVLITFLYFYFQSLRSLSKVLK
ncbi:hypothetical protein SAMN05661096_02332 [Marivirga sericea]|uniref:Uncharacterized protein n=1 Tax=Marivirga sericea TaxID=1028 RepID=A0A1X7K311_9BACT|nr:hypothetical protein [Marivirga sericea]SMG35349.1 hypothetical protein SAMN05661096_02332 [Marivirga sericea]